MTITLIIIAVVVVLGLMVVAMYNGLVKLKVRVEEAWSDITVQTKRRADLIPNLVNTVQGYAKHEKDVFTQVTEARAKMMSASSVKETEAADNMMTGALKSIFAIAESYPELKANENFIQLQNELVDSEDKIQAARRFYNSGVRDLNTKIEMFPTNLLAGMFGFVKREFFEVDDRSKIEEPVEVKF